MSPSCGICLEVFNNAFSLPCGHLFCQECLRRITSINRFMSPHTCPTCRASYIADPLDLATVPRHLRPHLLPGIRTVYLNQDEPKGSSPSLETTAIEIARLRAENDVLRHNCGMWQRRAEAHSSATLGLIELVRLARTQALYMKYEKDQLQKLCKRLKKKIHNNMAPPPRIPGSNTPPNAPFAEQHFGVPWTPASSDGKRPLSPSLHDGDIDIRCSKRQRVNLTPPRRFFELMHGRFDSSR